MNSNSKKKNVRVYHFLSAKYGLEGLQEKHIKVARLLELNDPFEFCCFDFSFRTLRENMGELKRQMSVEMGFICCSRSFSNPVQWAHYAQKHKGVCLGFDIYEDLCMPVTYVSERINIDDLIRSGASEEEIFFAMISTKFDHWRYEDEVRFPVHFKKSKPCDEMVFYKIGPVLKLKQVILGCDSDFTKSEVLEAIGGCGEGVEILKVRPDYKKFKMVIDDGVEY